MQVHGPSILVEVANGVNSEHSFGGSQGSPTAGLHDNPQQPPLDQSRAGARMLMGPSGRIALYSRGDHVHSNMCLVEKREGIRETRQQTFYISVYSPENKLLPDPSCVPARMCFRHLTQDHVDICNGRRLAGNLRHGAGSGGEAKVDPSDGKGKSKLDWFLSSNNSSNNSLATMSLRVMRKRRREKKKRQKEKRKSQQSLVLKEAGSQEGGIKIEILQPRYCRRPLCPAVTQRQLWRNGDVDGGSFGRRPFRQRLPPPVKEEQTIYDYVED